MIASNRIADRRLRRKHLTKIHNCFRRLCSLIIFKLFENNNNNVKVKWKHVKKRKKKNFICIWSCLKTKITNVILKFPPPKKSNCTKKHTLIRKRKKKKIQILKKTEEKSRFLITFTGQSNKSIYSSINILYLSDLKYKNGN